MATRKSSQSSATATAATTSANAEAQDDAVATSAASTPSGTNGPDGTNSSNTPPSGGDAAEEASVDSVKPQVTSDHNATILVGEDNKTPTPDVEASTSGNSSSGPSQDEEIGAGANAGSDQLIAELTLFMDASGLTELEQVVRVAEIGRNVLAEIELISIGNPEVARWLTDENPAGIIRELYDQVGYLGELLEDGTSPSDLNDKRRFLITKTIRLNHVLLEENEGVWLTFDEHALAFAANACEPDWHNGGTLPR